MAIEPGTFCLVRYQGFAEFHQRLVTCWLTGAEYMVVTPDFECFPEELSLANPDLTAVRIPRKGEEALGVPQHRVYTFRQALSSEQVERLIDEGRRLAAIKRLAEVRSCKPPSVPIATASSVAVVGEQTSPPGGVWIVDEPIEKYDIGAEVEFPPGAVDVGGRSIVAIDGASAVLRFMPGGESISAYVVARKSLLADDARIISPCRGEGVRSFAEAARDAARPRHQVQVEWTVWTSYGICLLRPLGLGRKWRNDRPSRQMGARERSSSGRQVGVRASESLPHDRL
eukprot:3984124-Amphidinium_carterae.1